MSLENTIQCCLDNYPILFKDREEVLIFLFCYIGNNYEWENGELISKDKDKKIINKLKNGENAHHFKSIDEIMLDFMYDTYSTKESVSFNDFKERFNELESSKKELIYKYNKNALERIWGNYLEGVENILSKKYSHIYNLPKDIKPDWLEGSIEVIEILRKNNISY